MSRIVLEMTPSQAEAMIRDLYRATVLLDLFAKQTKDWLQRHACLVQLFRLQELAEAIDAASQRPVSSAEPLEGGA